MRHLQTITACSRHHSVANLSPRWRCRGLSVVLYKWPRKPIFFSFLIQSSSVAQSCSTLCDPMNRSTKGLPVHHQLPEFTQPQVHRVGDAIQPSHPLSSLSPPAPNPSQHQFFKLMNSFMAASCPSCGPLGLLRQWAGFSLGEAPGLSCELLPCSTSPPRDQTHTLCPGGSFPTAGPSGKSQPTVFFQKPLTLIKPSTLSEGAL